MKDIMIYSKDRLSLLEKNPHWIKKVFLENSILVSIPDDEVPDTNEFYVRIIGFDEFSNYRSN